jgi:hypothetical protein
MQTDSSNWACADLKGFTQTRFFYGQRLDVHHFESEQRYVKGKLWMLNRMVHGYGVVCGLDVQPGDDHTSVVVLPGIALDKAGREIVVPCQSAKQPIPPVDPTPPPSSNGGASKPAASSNGQDCCDDDYVHICVCFQICDTDPEPVLAGACGSTERCSPGAIKERYKIEVRQGRSQPIATEPVIADLLIGNRINYPALARWVTEPCGCPPPDTCIPLANVKRPPAGGTIAATDVDITIRPIVYGNDLLYQILLALTNGDQSASRRSGK